MVLNTAAGHDEKVLNKAWPQHGDRPKKRASGSQHGMVDHPQGLASQIMGVHSQNSKPNEHKKGALILRIGF